MTVAFTTLDPAQRADVMATDVGPYATVLTVKYSLAQLTNDIAGLPKAAGGGSLPADSRINVRENRVEVLTTDLVATNTGLQAEGPLPASAQVIQVPESSAPEEQIYGGLDLWAGGCTTGFGVVKGGTRGVTTAAHCPNTEY